MWVSCIPRRKTLLHTMHWLQIATDGPYKNPDLVVKMASSTPTFSLSCWPGNSLNMVRECLLEGMYVSKGKGGGLIRELWGNKDELRDTKGENL